MASGVLARPRPAPIATAGRAANPRCRQALRAAAGPQAAVWRRYRAPNPASKYWPKYWPLYWPLPLHGHRYVRSGYFAGPRRGAPPDATVTTWPIIAHPRVVATGFALPCGFLLCPSVAQADRPDENGLFQRAIAVEAEIPLTLELD